MSAKEMFEKLEYACDESCDGLLYSKWVYENGTDYEIQINFEKRPICFRKTKTKEIFNPSRPDDITLEELQAINKQIEELWGDDNEKN